MKVARVTWSELNMWLGNSVRHTASMTDGRPPAVYEQQSRNCASTATLFHWSPGHCRD